MRTTFQTYKTQMALKIAMAQIAPIWLDKTKTIQKICETIQSSADEQPDLIVFGEGLLPGYPFWLAHTNGAAFEDPKQKAIHSYYVQHAITIEHGELNDICKLAKTQKCAIYLGIIERPTDRGGHSLYCSLVYINKEGNIQSVHRKLQPTYEERLSWSPGDGNGLQVHPLNGFTVGGLNCWENWMPLARTALYGLGENLHIAVWPGSLSNTEDITRFIAKEGRSFVVSVSSLLSKKDVSDELPHRSEILNSLPTVVANGGSCIAGPDGEWVVPPITDKEGVFYASINLNKVFEARQNFDPTGHYSRPSVTQLQVNRSRQTIVKYT